MGLGKDLKRMASEYRKDPKAQYFKYLKKTLDLCFSSHVSKKEVMEYVNLWFKE